MVYGFLAIGLVIGVALGWFAAKATTKSDTVTIGNDGDLKAEIVRLEERSKNLREELDRSLAEVEKIRNEAVEKDKRLAKAEEAFQNMREKFDHQQKDFESLQEKFHKEFELMASKVLRQNTEEISKINNEKLADTLKPLGEKIKTFEDKIEKSGKEREGLKEQIHLLHELNQRMADEASNLTKALKGDTKKQGNWGEIILERVLESSGLIKDQEYKMEVHSSNAEGNIIRPDAVVLLPDDKHIIVDSKVSLVAYDEFVGTEDEDAQELALKKHILSVRTHIKTLSSKEYQSSTDFNSPDFVLLFMPIESAFSIAIQYDAQMFSDAWDQKIILVSPTTLLATLRTIASVWKQERQTKNAIKIAEESGKLYDKFVGFVKDLDGIGRHIDQTQKAYDEAYSKLSTGRGNLVSRAENIKLLGAKAQKSIGKNLTEEAEGEVPLIED